jgi:hypothetical protein
LMETAVKDIDACCRHACRWEQSRLISPGDILTSSPRWIVWIGKFAATCYVTAQKQSRTFTAWSHTPVLLIQGCTTSSFWATRIYIQQGLFTASNCGVLHDAGSFLESWNVLTFSYTQPLNTFPSFIELQSSMLCPKKTFPTFNELKGPIPCSQEPTLQPYPEPVYSSPHPDTLFL